MPYHPSVGEEVSIERPFDADCFRARVTSVSGQPNDPAWEVTIEFEYLDRTGEEKGTCRLSDIAWSFDPAKEGEYREFQSRLISLDDDLDRAAQQKLLDEY